MSKGQVYYINFYPRSPCGERLKYRWQNQRQNQFLSTLSLRRATSLGLLGWLRTLISIHALLAESDPGTGHTGQQSTIHFYPRSPCGERRASNQPEQQKQRISIHALLAESDFLTLIIGFSERVFLSTLSLRRATRKVPLLGIK